MKIKRLEISQFRNHEHSVLDLSDVTYAVIKGSNYAGKSSIAQAISMALTPSTMSLDSAGRGFASKIRKGQTKAVITVDVQGGKRLVQNVVTLNTNTTGRTSRAVCLDDPEWHPSPFERVLESNRPALSVCLNTNAFLTMDEKAQKGLLARLALPATYAFPQETVDAVNKAVGEGTIDFSGEPFAVIDKAYKRLYEERQLVNRQVKEFTVPEPLPKTEGVDSASLQAKLEAARAARQRILTEKDAALRKVGDTENERTRVQTKLNGTLEEIEKEKAKIANIEAGLLSEGKHKEYSKIVEEKVRWEELTTAHSELTVKLKDYKHQSEHWSQASDEPSECPTCGQLLTKEYIAATKRFYDEAYKKTLVEDDEVMQDLKSIGDMEGAENALAKHNSAKDEIKALSVSIGEREAKAKIGKAKLESMGPKVDAGAAFEEPLISADNEISAIIEQMRPVIAAEERTKEIATRTATLERLQAKAASVDALVKVFDKDGIKAKLLKDNIGGFEEKMNATMAAFGYKCSLSIEPYEFLCTDTLGVTTPVRELSGSEELMFLVALQCAVSRASGIGIVVADRMDTFLPALRRKANQTLYSLVNSGTLEQVFIILSEDSEDAPALKNAAFFKVEQGTVRRLGKG